MNKRLVLVLLAMFLAACAPVAQQTDLYTEAQRARGTANAAQDLAQFQERFLTATAEAPIINITSTAAALIVQQTQASIDSTSTAVLWTPTVTQTPTPNATQTKVFIDLEAEQKAIQNNSERDQLALERERNNNAFWAEMGQMGPLLLLVLLAGGIPLLYMLITRNQRFKPVSVDPRGNPIPVMDLVHGTVTDSDSNPNYRSNTSDEILKRLFELWLVKKFGYQPPLPQITASRQDITKERDQMIDMATRGLLPETSGEARDRKKLALQQSMKQLSAPNMEGRFKIMSPEATNLDVIDKEIVKVLDAEWKEAEKK